MGKDVNKNAFADEILKFAEKIDYEDRDIADVISFNYADVESHLGIIIDEDYFIHAASNKRVLKNRISAFKSRICGVYRANA